jgi:hypothetical protein
LVATTRPALALIEVCPCNERGETLMLLRDTIPVSSPLRSVPIKTLAIIFATTLGRDEPGAALIEVLLPYNVHGETLTLGAVTIPASSPQKRNAAESPRDGPSLGYNSQYRRSSAPAMMAREPFPTTTASSEGGRSSWALAATPFGSFINKTISDKQMDVLIVLGALIALLAISGIVVWIYASRT